MFMDNKSLVLMAARACDEKKAIDIKLIKIDKVSFISEWILIAEGLSDVQVRSITNSVEGELREKAKVEPIRKEGVSEAKWALLDYGDLIVNIFQPEIIKGTIIGDIKTAIIKPLSVSYTHLTLPTSVTV